MLKKVTVEFSINNSTLRRLAKLGQDLICPFDWTEYPIFWFVFDHNNAKNILFLWLAMGRWTKKWDRKEINEKMVQERIVGSVHWASASWFPSRSWSQGHGVVGSSPCGALWLGGSLLGILFLLLLLPLSLTILVCTVSLSKNKWNLKKKKREDRKEIYKNNYWFFHKPFEILKKSLCFRFIYHREVTPLVINHCLKYFAISFLRYLH